MLYGTNYDFHWSFLIKWIRINRFRLRCKVTFAFAFRILRGFLQLESPFSMNSIDWLIHKEIVPTSVEVYPEPYGTSLLAPVSYLFFLLWKGYYYPFSVCVHAWKRKRWTQTNKWKLIFCLVRAIFLPYYLVQPRPQEATSPLPKDLIYLVGLTPEV